MAGSGAPSIAERVFGEGSDRVCLDIPDEACDQQAGNEAIHVASLTATKTGDRLVDPKLVLAWLVDALGGSAAAAGLIVPTREALALLPQLAIGHRIRALPRRKWVWAGASAGQGVAVAGMALVALLADGAAGAWMLVGLVALFAFARSFASVSYKDVLGKTVSKTRRGTVTGTGTSISAAAGLAFGLGLWSGLIPLTTTAIGIALFVAAALWVGAGLMFSRLAEAAGATEGGVDAWAATLTNVALLWTDPQLGLFVVARSLLTVTAIAPPYLLALSSAGDGGIDALGPFVIASSIATVVGGRLWGKLSDVSSRRVLLGAAGSSAVLFAVAGFGTLVDDDFLAARWAAAVLLFLLVLAYQGVRLGRSTHLVDMAPAEKRPVYTAVSNTVVGIVLLATGAFGLLSEVIGRDGLFLVFAGFSVAAGLVASRLDEVQA